MAIFTLTATAADSTTGQSGQGAASFTTGGPGPAVIRPVLNWTGSGLSLVTLAVNPQNTGDLLTLVVGAGGSGKAGALSSGVSGGGVSTWTRAAGFLDTGDHLLSEVWQGVVTARGPATITVTNPSLSGEWNRLWAGEYTASGAGITWSVVTAAPSPAASSAGPSGTGAAVSYPSLPGSGLYLGAACSAWGTLSAGTAAGFSYTNLDGHLEVAADVTAVNGAPGARSSDSGDHWVSAAVLISASSTPVPLAVATTSLPGGVTGQSYNTALAAAGGVLPYTWSLVAGSLPAGLSLSAAGVIGGTPAAAAASSFTVKVTDSAAHTAIAVLSITVTAAPPAVFTAAFPPGGEYFAPVTDPALSVAGNTQVPSVNMNVWGPVSGETGTLQVYTPRNWSLTMAMSNSQGSVTCFPNTGIAYPVSIPWSGWNHFISGWDETMDATQNQTASACYDNYVDNTLVNQVTGEAIQEIMLHFDFRNRGSGPWFSQNVPFGGYTVNGIAIPLTYWSLAVGGGAAFFNLTDGFSNIASLPAGAVDLLAMYKYLVASGLISSSCNITGIGLGYEICDTQGANRNFRYNDMWCYAA